MTGILVEVRSVAGEGELNEHSPVVMASGEREPNEELD